MRSSTAKARLARILDVSMITYCGPLPDVCDCCGRPNVGNKPKTNASPRKLAWDHEHTSGEFRGWLCHSCNVTLGHVGDSVERLQQLIDYLNRFEARRRA